MKPLPAWYVLLSLTAGAVWGAIGLALAGQMFGASVWGGVVASPAIGLAIAVLFRGFRDRPPAMRISLSLVSLYLASGLFALAAGIVDASRPVPHRNSGAVVIQAVMGVWWGITFAGYMPLLWPLAYLSHSLLGRADAGGGGGAAAGQPGRIGPATTGPAREARGSDATPTRANATLTRSDVTPIRHASTTRGNARPTRASASPTGGSASPMPGNATPTRGAVMIALAAIGALFLLAALRGGRGPLGELAALLAFIAIALFAGRGAWRWWRGQPASIASAGVVGALGVAGAGWLLVGLVHALSRVSSENYGMIIVWPIVFLIGIVVICGGVLAAAAGMAAVVTAMTRSPAHRALIAVGGGAAVLLNLLHVLVLTRLLYTG